MSEPCLCENLEKCEFFNKYQMSKELACKGFIAQFCKGMHQSECRRREHKKVHGVAPPDDMMPSGQMMAA